AAALVAILVFTITAPVIRAQEEQPKTGAAAGSTVSLGRFVPRPDLISYLEYQSLDAHAGAWQKTALHRLLFQTQLGTLLEDLAIQAIHVSQAMFPATIPVKGVDAVDIVKRIARNGFVVAVFGKPRQQWRYLAVLRQCDRPEIRSAITSVAANLRAQAG